VTWIVSASALILAGSAGLVMLQGKDEGAPSSSEPSVEAAPAASATPPASAKPRTLEEEIASPLTMTAQTLDAKARAALWSREAQLAAIRWVVVSGKPEGALEFDFGVPRGPSVPFAPLRPERVTIRYEGRVATQTTGTSPTPQVALPEPNCPLEVAHLKATQTGLSGASQVAVLYGHSRKHGRALWTFTDPQGRALFVDGDQCLVLTR